jgi:23S rRNA (cytosine1962-C5)-methyltransferase
VDVYADDGSFLAKGHFQDGSIVVRIISFEQGPIDLGFWKERIRRAWKYRQIVGLADNAQTNCYRLVHAEGDGLPGLIIDIYDHVAVIQCHSIGMYLAQDAITEALKQVLGTRLTAIYSKSKDTLPGRFAATVEDGYLFGQASGQLVRENGHLFWVDWIGGQKTGFFLDQRDNRALVAKYAAGKEVLNAYSYSGGFSVYALAAGAREVHSVDISAKAIEAANRNVDLNQNSAQRHHGYAQDVLKFLKEARQEYDLVIVDPPAFAKSLKKRHNAVQGYKRLNKEAIEKVKPGGLLFTFSCSQVVDKTLFYNTVVAAAIEAGRQARVVHYLDQPADHPVQIFHPEAGYLKGLVLYIE